MLVLNIQILPHLAILRYVVFSDLDVWFSSLDLSKTVLYEVEGKRPPTAGKLVLARGASLAHEHDSIISLRELDDRKSSHCKLTAQ